MKITTNIPYQLSIVTTVDAQEEICTDFAQKLALYTYQQKLLTQLIFVDDLNALTQEITPDNNDFLDIEVITPPIRQGQFKAILLGLQKTSADIILVIDPDMTQNIKDIHLFIEKINIGSHVVFGQRVKRLDVSLIRRWISFLFNFLARIILHTKIRDINTPMIMATRNALQSLNILDKKSTAHKFYLCHQFKNSLDEVPIIIETTKKKSNYSIKQRIIAFYPEFIGLIKYAIQKKLN